MPLPAKRTIAIVVCACALFSGAPSYGAEDRRAEIQDLLDRRAEAILDEDREAFLETVDGARGDFRRRQLRLFDALSDVPLAGYTLEAQWAAYGDLARRAESETYDSDDVAIPYVRESYRLKGIDRRAVYHDVYFTFVERDGRWSIVEDSDLDALGLFTQRSLWDFGPVRMDSSEHFTSITERCCAPDTGRLLSTAEQALGRVDRYWHRRWNKRVPLLTPASTEHLSRILQASYPVENYIAFAYWTGGAGDSVGARVIVNPERFSGDGSLRSFEILTHELFHVASLPYSGPFIPNWLDEGIAQYVQYDGSPGRIDQYHRAVATTGDAHAPESFEFFVGDEGSVFRQYQKSLSLIGYIVDTWGYERLERLYVRLGRAGGSVGLESYHIDRALRRVLGVGLRELERRWASSIGV